MKRLETKEDVYALLNTSINSAALGAAVETGLLWLLADKPMDAAGVAQKLNIPLRRCSYWLQILHVLGILEKVPQGYAPSALTRTSILETQSQASWEYLVKDERERAAGIHNLPLFIGEPGSVWQAQGLDEPKDYVERMRRDPERARAFTRMLFEVHQYLGTELAEAVDLANAHRLMDLGGNSGVVSMALLRKYPDLTATIVDLENVCLVGREIVEENGLADRLSYHPAEFFDDDFPSGFDVILQCDVSIFEMSLFNKLWSSLNPNGRLIMVNHFSPAENVPPAKRLEWSFLDSLEDPEFSIPTIAQVRERLARAGFRTLPGETVLSDQRTVIQAYKEVQHPSRTDPPADTTVSFPFSAQSTTPTVQEDAMDQTITLYKWILPTFFVSARSASVERLSKHLTPLVHPGAEILDLCCGSGPASFWLEKQQAKVTGVDFAPYMINLANEEAVRRNSSAAFIEADIFLWDFGQACFDIVTCFGNSISDFPLSDFEKLIPKVARALRPGGLFLLQYQDGIYPIMQGTVSEEGVYQESPERITFLPRKYLPELSALDRVWRNETLGKEYSHTNYIYTAPIVHLLMNHLFKVEQHTILREDHFLDVFSKRSHNGAFDETAE